MEAAFVNTVHEGDVVVVAVNGLFGQRMCDVAARCGAEVVAVEHEWGTPVDVDRVLAAHPSPGRSSPRCTPRPPPACAPTSRRSAPARATRCWSPTRSPRIGGIELRADDWGIDVGYAGTQKCLGVAPGLAPFTINDRAFERRVEKPRSWYLDLGLLGGYVGEASGSGGRTYHHTAPTAMVVSLHAGLGRILDEGLPEVWARHAEAGRLLQDGLEEMGLELFAAEGWRLPELTTVKVPDGVDSAAVRRCCWSGTASRSARAPAPYAATVWRIGLMGHNARPDAALLVLAALRDVLARVG